MTKPFTEWTVLPHGRMTRLEDDLMTVAGVIHIPPMGDVARRMTVVRLAGGDLVVYSAFALDEAEMSALDDFGRPAWLIVPSGIQRMDAKIWREAALVVHTSRGTTLVLNDLIFNLANRPGLGGWLWKTVGMTGDEPHLPPLVKLRLVTDEAAVRAQLERWARIPTLHRIIVSHGPIIEKDPSTVLDRVAHALAA